MVLDPATWLWNTLHEVNLVGFCHEDAVTFGGIMVHLTSSNYDAVYKVIQSQFFHLGQFVIYFSWQIKLLRFQHLPGSDLWFPLPPHPGSDRSGQHPHLALLGPQNTGTDSTNPGQKGGPQTVWQFLMIMVWTQVENGLIPGTSLEDAAMFLGGCASTLGLQGSDMVRSW